MISYHVKVKQLKRLKLLFLLISFLHNLSAEKVRFIMIALIDIIDRYN